MSIKTHTLYITGTHCSACKHLVEEKLAEEQDLTNVTVSLKEETVTFETSKSDDVAVLSTYLTSLLSEYGYGVHGEKQIGGTKKNEWLTAVLGVAVVVFGFVLLERMGLTSLIGTGEGTLVTAFLVGLVASVSTCLAVVGGLVLSVSATYAQKGNGWRPQVHFHLGRLVGFFILGGMLGALGEVIQIGFIGSTVLGVIASLVMLVLGIHLLDITKKVSMFTLPKGVSNFFANAAHRTGALAPVLLGAVTFFLPCGFTQSMQIVSLSSGSAVTGALTMLIFALGTLPVLALLSFGSLDLAKSQYKGVFFKTAGILVILFALFNMHNAFVVFGVIPPVISF